MKYKIYLLLISIIAVINFLPVLGLFSAQQMSQAYGVLLDSSEIELLMRHRALLFGIIGGFVFYSLFKPAMRLPALIMSGISMIGFLVLVLITGQLNAAIMKIFMVDVIGVICLVLALLIQTKSSAKTAPD